MNHDLARLVEHVRADAATALFASIAERAGWMPDDNIARRRNAHTHWYSRPGSRRIIGLNPVPTIRMLTAARAGEPAATRLDGDNITTMADTINRWVRRQTHTIVDTNVREVES